MGENRSAPLRSRSVRGRRVGRYVLVEHLATGGMAEIFLARLEGEAGFSKELVLKVMQERYADNPAVVRMFLEEARLGADLRHPHVVDVFELGESDGLRFIAMEYLEGRTLTEVVTRGLEVARPLSRAHAAHIVGQVAEGLAYLQGAAPGARKTITPPGATLAARPSSPIVHRDISPPNLIVGWAGQTKIIDFGIARRVDAPLDEEAGLRPGKVSYMSPEQVRGEPLDGRSDVFSLGTILYEITLGRRLWRGPAATVMQRIVDETPPPPSYVDRGYPAALERVVLRALEKRPGDRYPGAAEMASDLERFLEQSERVSDRQLATYLAGLWSEEAVVSAGGARQAQAFGEDEEGGWDLAAERPLDFDRPLGGSVGADLAHALRDAHPIDLALGVGRGGAGTPSGPGTPGPATSRTRDPSGSRPVVPGLGSNLDLRSAQSARSAVAGSSLGGTPAAIPALSPGFRPAGPPAPEPRGSRTTWARVLLVAAVVAGVVAGALIVL